MFDGCMYFNTTALARVLDKRWSLAFAPFDLTAPQGFMLRAVLSHPGSQQRQLANELVISKPTATRILDGLQAKGLIDRRPSAQDGREWQIHPTAAALRLRESLDAASATVTASIKRLIGADSFNESVRRIREVRSAME
jgi:DNA-binding MarR family transcriptional regulator